MKWYYYLFFLSVLSLFSCLGQQTDDKTKEQRDLLKEYFLCECITEGFDDKNIQEDDISQSVLTYSIIVLMLFKK